MAQFNRTLMTAVREVKERDWSEPTGGGKRTDRGKGEAEYITHSLMLPQKKARIRGPATSLA